LSKLAALTSMDQFEGFFDKDYTGVDVGDGKGVDLVGQGQLLEFPSGHLDTAISCECLEHNTFWSETVANMMRMTRPGGLVVLTCASTGRKEHGTTRSILEFSPLTNKIGWDYYRNVSAFDLARAINLSRWLDRYIHVTNWNSNDLYLIGIRTGGECDDAGDLRALECKIEVFVRTNGIKNNFQRAVGIVIGDAGFMAIAAGRRSLGRIKRKLLAK